MTAAANAANDATPECHPRFETRPSIPLLKSKDYGFAETSDGQEVYFLKNGATGDGFDKLEVGSEVRLVIAENQGVEGGQASTVTPIDKHHIHFPNTDLSDLTNLPRYFCKLMPNSGLQRKREAVIGDVRVDPMLLPEDLDPGGDRPRVAAYDFTAAMGKDGLVHRFPFAPAKLHRDRRVPNESMVPPAHHGSLDRGPITHIESDALQGLASIADGNEVRDIKEGRVRCAHAIANRRCAQRVIDGEGFEADRADLEWLSRVDDAAITDRITSKQRPRLFGGVDGTWRAMCKAKGVIGMRVGDDNGGGRDGLQRLEPIGATIDHDAGPPLPNEEGAVTVMAARPELDLAAGSDKGQLDGAPLPPMGRDQAFNPS